jgi:hypothetical protein
MPTAIIVTGSREWTDRKLIGLRLRAYPIEAIVIHGNAGGADKIAHQIARDDGSVVVPVPYFSWLGKTGGMERNRVMLHILLAYRADGYDVAVEAFPLPSSIGTWGMMGLAADARVPVFDKGVPWTRRSKP